MIIVRTNNVREIGTGDRYARKARPAAVGRQPLFPMFAESSLWKCETFDVNDSLRASLRTHTIGHLQSLIASAQHFGKQSFAEPMDFLPSGVPSPARHLKECALPFGFPSPRTNDSPSDQPD